MNTRQQLRAQQAANKKLQEQVLSYEKDLEALRSNFSVSQSQASIAKVSTEINSKVNGHVTEKLTGQPRSYLFKSRTLPATRT